jgi:hypothetical protein
MTPSPLENPMNVARTAASALMIPLLLLAPEAVAGQSRMSVVGGMAVAELAGEGGEEFDSRRGLHIGAFAELPVLGGTVSFIPGGYYIEKGFSEGENLSVKMSYFQIMAPVRLGLPLGETFSVSAFGGPGFAMEMGCLFKEIDGDIERTIGCQGSDFRLKGHDLTGVVGAGVAVAVSPQISIVLSGSLDQSLVTIGSAETDTGLKTRTWLISGGVSYPLERR